MRTTQKPFHAVLCTETKYPNVSDQFFQFRKKLFVDGLDWNLAVRDGRERDQFDTDATVHCALFHAGCLIAGFRAIRTDQPYLASSIFPYLATFRPFPRRHDVWEISRLGIQRSAAVSNASQILYALMFYFSHRYRAKSLVAIGEVKQERLLSRLGVKTRRYGPPQLFDVGDGRDPISIVAGETPIAEQRGERFEALLKLIDHVEIQHETLELERLSA